MQNKLLLSIGIGLIVLGLYNSNVIKIPSTNNNQCRALSIAEPSDPELRALVEPIIDILKSGSDDRKIDGCRLAELYRDMSILIGLDQEDNIIDNTNTIKNANALSAKLLKINLNNKYPDLANTCDNVIKQYVSENDVSLDEELKTKAANAFLALSWAFLQGSR